MKRKTVFNVLSIILYYYIFNVLLFNTKIVLEVRTRLYNYV